MTQNNHLRFTDLIRIAQGGETGKKGLHLLQCKECSKGFLVAKALVGRWKSQGKPISVILGDVTQGLRNLACSNAILNAEIIGDPETLGVELRHENEGLNARIVSDAYEVSGLKIKIYKLGEDKTWTEHKSAAADVEGFVFLGQIAQDAARNGLERYVASVHGILRPKQKPDVT